MTTKPSKILYVASTASHLRRFHLPYINALRQNAEVYTMATGEGVDFPIRFDKRFFSFANLCSISKIRKIIKREQIDVLLLHTTLAAFFARAALFGMKKRPYVCNVVHGYLFPKNGTGLKDRILLFCEMLMKNKTDDIAVMNAEDYEIANMHTLCLNRVYSIAGMGVADMAEKVVPDPELRARLAMQKEDFVCTFVGELSGRKNQIFLIRAAEKLREEGIPIRLLLVGDGGMREELEEEVKALGLGKVVAFTGNQEPVLPYLSITDLYVSASRSEGLPFNIMEAMSCGLPIVASDTKGQNDLLKEHEESLYPPDDMDAFCMAVRRVYVSGRYGVGKYSYPELEQYRLHTVFEANMKILMLGCNHHENRN